MKDLYLPEYVLPIMRRMDPPVLEVDVDRLRSMVEDAVRRCSYRIFGIQECDPTCACVEACRRVP